MTLSAYARSWKLSATNNFITGKLSQIYVVYSNGWCFEKQSVSCVFFVFVEDFKFTGFTGTSSLWYVYSFICINVWTTF